MLYWSKEGSVKMLDVKTLKVLEFLNEHQDEQFSIYQMCQRGMTVNFETMDWLHNREMVFRYEDEEMFSYPYEEPEYLYQINAGGRVALEEQKHSVKTEKRAKWAFIISVISLLISALTALKGLKC